LYAGACNSFISDVCVIVLCFPEREMFIVLSSDGIRSQECKQRLNPQNNNKKEEDDGKEETDDEE
jgi:hypothetical protein